MSPLRSRNLCIRAARLAFRALPQAEAPSLRRGLGEIHEMSVLGTADARDHVSLDRFRVLGNDEVPSRTVVVDETPGLVASIEERFCRLAVQF